MTQGISQDEALRKSRISATRRANSERTADEYVARMSDVDTAWLAGLLEGEGCFTRTGVESDGRRSISIQLEMNDRDVVERVALLFGTSCRIRVPKSGFCEGKTHYRAALRGYRAARLLECLLPYMGERRSTRILGLLAEGARA